MLGFGWQAMDISVSKKGQNMCYSLNVTSEAQETTVIVFTHRFVLAMKQGA